MRTSLTFGQRELAIPFKEVLNRTIRAELGEAAGPERGPIPKTIPHSFGFKPGIDLDKLNQLVDELEAETFVESWEEARDSPRRQRSRPHTHRYTNRPAGVRFRNRRGRGCVGHALGLYPHHHPTKHYGAAAGLGKVLDRIESWLELPHVHIPHPAEGHFTRLRQALERLRDGGESDHPAARVLPPGDV